MLTEVLVWVLLSTSYGDSGYRESLKGVNTVISYHTTEKTCNDAKNAIIVAHEKSRSERTYTLRCYKSSQILIK